MLAEQQTGERFLFEIEKPADEPLGIVPEPDKIRRCTNACPFCFVKGNPKLDKLRAPLYVKDDDYRLSFLHGHYITLTNLRPDDWDRIFEQRLSPLYVSVHSTDSAVRLRMLKNPRSANIGQDLDRLAGGRIVVHAQVVLCPEVNDGEHLTRTIEDLYRRGEAIRSLSIVPVGLTSWNAAMGGRTLEPAECRAALNAVDAIRERALSERGQGWCYAADELYLQAGLEPPGAGYFDDQELESNGVGAISTLTDRVTGQLEALGPLEGYRVVAVTGTSMGPTMTRLAGRVARREFRVFNIRRRQLHLALTESEPPIAELESEHPSILFPLARQPGPLQKGQLRHCLRGVDFLHSSSRLVHQDPWNRALRGHYVVAGLEDRYSRDIAGIDGERDFTQQSAFRAQGHDPPIPIVDKHDVPVPVQRHRPEGTYLTRTTSLASPGPVEATLWIQVVDIVEQLINDEASTLGIWQQLRCRGQMGTVANDHPCRVPRWNGTPA